MQAAHHLTAQRLSKALDLNWPSRPLLGRVGMPEIAPASLQPKRRPCIRAVQLALNIGAFLICIHHFREDSLQA